MKSPTSSAKSSRTGSRRSPAASRAATKTKALIRKILMPVDFSTAGEPALAYAKSLAESNAAKVCFVHVMDPIFGPGKFYAGGEFSYVQLSSSEVRERVSRKIEDLQTGLFEGIPTDFEIRCGNTFDEIVEAAVEQEADLIVMATHGYTGLKHVLLGSTAERVVRHAQCPVLVVRSQKLSEPRKPSKKAGKGRKRR